MSQIMKIFDGKLKLISKTPAAHELFCLRFSVTPSDFKFQAGQFLSINFGENKWRAYSIASSPREKEVELAVRLVPNGVASEIFRESKINDEFVFKGPFSDFHIAEDAEEIIFCATGTGIAPIRSMIGGMENIKNKKIKLFYGGKNENDLPYLNEVRKWDNENFEVFLGLSREIEEKNWENETFIKAEKCRITKFLEEETFNDKCVFYLCGNGKMVESVCDILAKKGIDQKKIFFERFN